MFDTFIVDPMINALLVLYDLLFNNYVLAIAVFTILIRLITLPLNLRQQRSMQKTQEMQPQIQAIQKKYKDNPQRMQEEFQKIGYNPTESLMGCLPLLIQMPILFGLYRAIIVTLGSTPQAMFELTQRTYPFIDLTAASADQQLLLVAEPGPAGPLLHLADPGLRHHVAAAEAVNAADAAEERWQRTERSGAGDVALDADDDAADVWFLFPVLPFGSVHLLRSFQSDRYRAGLLHALS